MKLVLFLLCSGLFHLTVSSYRLRFFSLNHTAEFDRDDSLMPYQQESASFVTLYDDEDVNFIVNFTASLNKASVLVGLRRRSTNSTWSDGVPFSFNYSSVNVTIWEQICEAIENNTWRGFNCSERKAFMCYKGNNYTLIQKRKNWCQALQYCRTHFTDLVSISNETQNNEVIEKGNNTSFWIGLLHDLWEWEDKGCSSFRTWCTEDRDLTAKCTAKTTFLARPSCQDSIKTFKCTNVNTVLLCSKGNVRITVIKESLTWEQAFDYCKANHTGLLQIEDERDQLAVEQWLSATAVISHQFWIGLRQSRVFGFWIWSDKTVSYSNWRNNKQPEIPLSNNCGVISVDDYKWSDENCLVPHYFICEEKITFMNKSKAN